MDLEEARRLKKAIATAATALALSGGNGPKQKGAELELAPAPTKNYPGVTHRPTYNYKLVKTKRAKYVKGKCSAGSCELKRVPVSELAVMAFELRDLLGESQEMIQDKMAQRKGKKGVLSKALRVRRLVKKIRANITPEQRASLNKKQAARGLDQYQKKWAHLK